MHGLSEERHTHERTPPISPSVYPVTKSFEVLVARSPAVATPVGGLLGNGNAPPAGPNGLLGGMSPPFTLVVEPAPAPANRAGLGLCGREVGQYWRSSRLSSWPVVVQLVRMLSRRSWT
jgi:hypothetical protein